MRPWLLSRPVGGEDARAGLSDLDASSAFAHFRYLEGGGSEMTELVRWETDDGSVVVEVGSHEPGFQAISRKPGEIIYDAKGRFEDALENVRSAAISAVKKFRDETLNPNQ